MNIIFIMTDQHRADHVSFLPEGKVATPNIDRIAGSVAFSRCVSVNPICTPARTALLTGKYTHQIGMLDMSGDLHPEHPTYLRALRECGYWTGAVGKLHWNQNWPWGTPAGKGHDLVALREQIKEYGLDYLWEAAGKQLAVPNYCDYARYLDGRGLLAAYREHVASRGPNLQIPERTRWTGEPWPFDEAHYVDNVIGDEALAALAARPKDRPFFLFVSFCGPHKPYDPPLSCLDAVPPDERDDFIVDGEPMSDAVKKRLYSVRRAYRAMIHCVDLQVGRLLRQLEAEELLDETVLLFTSDHGEMLGDHNRMSKAQPWQQAMIVPTAIRHPEHLRGARCDSPVELTDLTATILDVAGLRAEEALAKAWPAYHDRVPCRSLMPIVRGETEGIRDFAFSECRTHYQALVGERWKYVRFPATSEASTATEALYDLVSDPHELRNLAGEPEQAPRLADLRQRRERLFDLTPPAQTGWAPFG